MGRGEEGSRISASDFLATFDLQDEFPMAALSPMLK